MLFPFRFHAVDGGDRRHRPFVRRRSFFREREKPLIICSGLLEDHNSSDPQLWVTVGDQHPACLGDGTLHLS
jgi:hypothetical protein